MEIVRSKAVLNVPAVGDDAEVRCRPSAGAVVAASRRLCVWPPAAAADQKVRAPREPPRCGQLLYKRMT
ncbi:MAG: hypothetical protein OXG81_00390 [Acidobacteria bacterium]|nr:hypothetical protein [Acidobacteriota bacterium]